jgi:hypothetical protein
MINGGRPVCSPALTGQVTIYGWSTKDEKPVRFPYKVSQTDPEVFYIAVNTKKCDCTWIAELFWTTRGKNGSTIIDDNGRPFRVTSSGNSASYYSNDGQTFVRTQA